MMKIIPIVEGHGEVLAVPVLLRRLRDRMEEYRIEIGRPILSTCTELSDPARLQRKVRIAAIQTGCVGIIVIFDSDDRCPKTEAPVLVKAARAASGHIPCELAMAHREYESWFLASFESIRGHMPFVPGAAAPPSPEMKRGAKEYLTSLLPEGRSYSPTADQARLTQAMDVDAAYNASRSFRHLVDAFGRLVRASQDSRGNTTPYS